MQSILGLKSNPILIGKHGQLINQPHVVFSNIRQMGIGKTLVIVANGPSHKEVKLEKLLGKVDFMCINKPDERVWQPKFWAFSDSSQSDLFKKEIKEYNGLLVNTTSIAILKSNQVRLKPNTNPGFSLDIEKEIFIGRSTTYIGLQFGVYAKYEKIFIFGVDMNLEGKPYPWGSNLAGVSDRERRDRFKAEQAHWDVGANTISQDIKNKIWLISKYNQWPFFKKFQTLDQDDSPLHIGRRFEINNILDQE